MELETKATIRFDIDLSSGSAEVSYADLLQQHFRSQNKPIQHDKSGLERRDELKLGSRYGTQKPAHNNELDRHFNHIKRDPFTNDTETYDSKLTSSVITTKIGSFYVNNDKLGFKEIEITPMRKKSKHGQHTPAMVKQTRPNLPVQLSAGSNSRSSQLPDLESPSSQAIGPTLAHQAAHNQVIPHQVPRPPSAPSNLTVRSPALSPNQVGQSITSASNHIARPPPAIADQIARPQAVQQHQISRHQAKSSSQSSRSLIAPPARISRPQAGPSSQKTRSSLPSTQNLTVGPPTASINPSACTTPSGFSQLARSLPTSSSSHATLPNQMSRSSIVSSNHGMPTLPAYPMPAHFMAYGQSPPQKPDHLNLTALQWMNGTQSMLDINLLTQIFGSMKEGSMNK